MACSIQARKIWHFCSIESSWLLSTYQKGLFSSTSLVGNTIRSTQDISIKHIKLYELYFTLIHCFKEVLIFLEKFLLTLTSEVHFVFVRIIPYLSLFFSSPLEEVGTRYITFFLHGWHVCESEGWKKKERSTCFTL